MNSVCQFAIEICHAVVSTHTWPNAMAIAEKPSAAAAPAAVPSKLMAPSVPRGTLDKFVIRKVVLPYACVRMNAIVRGDAAASEWRVGRLRCSSKRMADRQSAAGTHTFPISLETVSESLLTKLATNAICKQD